MTLTDEEIIAAFPRCPSTLHFRELVRAFGVDHDDRPALRERVRALVASGQLERVRGSRYGRPMEQVEAIGTLSMTTRGFGFVAVEGGGEDIYVDGRNLAGAMHRDRVALRLGRGSRGRGDGVVVRVLERGTHSLVGTVRIEGARRVVHPQDPRLPDQLNLIGETTAVDGDLVAVEIVEYGDASHAPTAQVERIFGSDGEGTRETDVVVYDLGLRLAFPEAVEAEADAYGEVVDGDEVARRIDLRARPLVTVDPESARDFDDAICASPRAAGGGWLLTVAVADVSWYVRPGSSLDEEARARGTSVYLPDRVIPMLPHALSEHLCSLRPHVDRLAMAVEIEVSPQGEIEQARFFEAVIRSHARFTYERVARMLGIRGPDDAPEMVDDPEHEALRPTLENLLHVTRARRRFRSRRGYLDLDIAEPRVVLDADGQIEGVRPSERNEAHRLVEEAMLLANEAVAQRFVDREEPTIFRVHDEPGEDSYARFCVQAAALDARPAFSGRVTPARLTKYLRGLESHPNRALLSMLLLRSMSKAVYEEESAPHFGLGAPTYLHFTSPIRRYPDLVVHRLLRASLRGEPAGDPDALGDRADHCSRRERLAVDAERTVLDLYKALYIQRFIGEEFDGFAVGITGSGIFVQIEGLAVEGFVHVEGLTDDYYEFDSDQQMLTGRRTRRTWRLGDRARIQVESVDVRRRRVQFSLVERLAART